MGQFYGSLSEVAGGQPGDLTRSENAVIIPAQFASETQVTPGSGVTFDTTGKLKYMSAAADVFAGVAVREYPSLSGYPESINYEKGQLIGVMKKGNCLVKCQNGTPVQGGKVYVYYAATGVNKPGDFSATLVSSYTIEVPNAFWGSSGVDVNNLAEISLI